MVGALGQQGEYISDFFPKKTTLFNDNFEIIFIFYTFFFGGGSIQ